MRARAARLGEAILTAAVPILLALVVMGILLAALGRDGVAALVERCCAHARRFAEGLQAAGHEVLNEVVLNQVAVACGDGPEGDAATRAVLAEVQAEGTAYPSAGRWRGREIMRISVSAGPATVADGERTAESVIAAWRRVRGRA